MAAPTDVSRIGRGPVGSGVSEPRASWAADSRPTGPDLLAEAAAVLPVVVGRGPVRCVDVHTALYEAACLEGVGRDRPHRLRLADEALDRFAGYLLAAGLATRADRVRDTIRGWLVDRDPTEVQLALAAGAGYWRRAFEGTPAAPPASNASVG